VRPKSTRPRALPIARTPSLCARAFDADDPWGNVVAPRCDRAGAEDWLHRPDQWPQLGRRTALRIAGSRSGGAVPPPAWAQLATALHLVLAQPPSRELEAVAPAHFAAPTVARGQLRRSLDVALSISLNRRTTEGLRRRRLEERRGADESNARHGDTCRALEWHVNSPLDCRLQPASLPRPLAPPRSRRTSRCTTGRQLTPTFPRGNVSRIVLALATARLRLKPIGILKFTEMGWAAAQRRSPAARRRSIICE